MPARCGSVACLRQTRGDRFGKATSRSSYTITRDLTRRRAAGVCSRRRGRHSEPPFEGQGVLDDSLEIVIAWAPAEFAPDSLGCRHYLDRIAGATRRGFDHKRLSIDAGYRVQHLANRISVAVTTVQSQAPTAAKQMLQRAQMRVCQIADVDEIAHAGAVCVG